MGNNAQKSTNKTLLLISMLTALGGSVLMLVSLLLPYITGASGMIESSSMVSYVKLAFEYGDQLTGSSAFGIIMLVMVILIGLFSFLAVIFSLVKKPIPVLVFTILACVVFCIQCWDFTSRGVVGEYALSWGAAYYTFIIGVVVALGGAVFMIIQKNRIKLSEGK